MPEHTLSLAASLQALLFVSGEPLPLGRLSSLTAAPKKNVRETLENMRQHLDEDDQSGLTLILHEDRAELVTKNAGAPLAQALLQSTREEALSKAALEVLAIIAYRSPVTRSHIEAIRGVNCSFTLRNLLLRGLIDRSENPTDTREYLYRPSFALLERLGLGSIENLPDYATLSQDERLSMVAEPDRPSSSETT